jgi:hypothetical protein
MAEKLPSFVRAVEVWIPDGDLLQRQSGAYGHLAQFEQASSALVLKRGQGLPGAAWASMQPEVWQELGASFVRAESARLAGLDAAVALPLFRGHELASVVVFFCGSRHQTGGCIEIWEPTEDGRLKHRDGYYGRLARFEAVSRATRFARGEGLPGSVLQRGSPYIVEDLRSSGAFVRSAAAREDGVQSGLGLPLYFGSQIANVALFLSAESTPLARAFEVWTPTPEGYLERTQAFYAEGMGAFAEAGSHKVASDADLQGRAFSSGQPLAIDCAQARSFGRREAAEACGLDLAVALPIHDGERVRSVVLLFG